LRDLKILKHAKIKGKTMPDENLFLEHKHSSSRRIGVLEDDATSAWLYLTEPDSRKPSGDAWVYNRIAAPPMDAIKSYRGGPPPAAEGFAKDSDIVDAPTKHEWTFVWSNDGESVAVLMDGEPMASIVAGNKGGHSRRLLKEGPWGHPWSEKLYQKTFDSA
jgi:hypothetical protein